MEAMEATTESSTEKGLSLGCILTRDESTKRQQHDDKVYSIGLEENKKASFQLQFDGEEISFERPCHVIIQTSFSQLPFRLGGFEFVSNSRSIEVYITESNEKKEEYLTTCRGVKLPDNNLHFKALLVIPGGPRAIIRLRLKLLSAQPKGTTNSCIHLMKLKCQLPPAAATKIQQPPVTNQGIPSNNNQGQHPSPAMFLSQFGLGSAPQPTAPASPSMPASDISAGLAGISMMVRSTEDRLMGAMKTQFIQQQQIAEQKFNQQHQILLTTLQTMQNTQQQLMNKVVDLEAQNTLLQQLLLRKQGEGISNIATVDNYQKEEVITTDGKIVEGFSKSDGEQVNTLHQTMLEKGGNEDDKPNSHRSPLVSSENGMDSSVDADDIQGSIVKTGFQEILNNQDKNDDEDKPACRPPRLMEEDNSVEDVLEPPDKSSPCNNNDVKQESDTLSILEEN